MQAAATDASSSTFSINISNAALQPGGGIVGSASEEASGFVGLSNQGATCYMNSLLQSLFMTPEFRAGVYKIPVETDSAKQKDSICFQLQSLFASMQLSKKVMGGVMGCCATACCVCTGPMPIRKRH